MRKFAIVLVALLAVATSTSVQDQINALLQTGTKASDAIQTVLDLLRDLKQENFDAQTAADQKNETDEYIGGLTIAKFQEIQHLNQKLYSQSVENRERFENELRDTKNYLAWNEARVDELQDLIKQRAKHQCYSNQIFIRNLWFAIQVRNWMAETHADMRGYLNQEAAGLVQVEDKKSIAEKLKSNIELYNHQAVKAFVRMAEGQEEEEEEAPVAQGGRKGTFAEQIIQIAEEAEQNIENHVKILRESEIDASFEFADWIDLVRAEIEFLHQEHERKTVYADRLETQIKAALAQQAKSKQILQESQNALDQAIADLEAKRQAYAEAKAKRDEENIVLDEVIQIFKDQVTGWSGR